MGKMTKSVLCAIGSTVALGLLHAWLYLGFDPARAMSVSGGAIST